jgi:hypothetical protein
MSWMQTGKLIGGKMDTAMRWCGQFFAGPRSRTECVRDQFGDVDSSRLRTGCGQFKSVAAAGSRTVEAAALLRTRTVRGRACLRGLNADMDSSRTWTVRGHGLSPTESRSRICQVRGHAPLTSRGYSACSPRLPRGRRNLAPARGKACPVLNMMRNTLPPLIQQFVAPVLQLCGNGLDAGGLFNRPHFDAPGVVCAKR